MAQNLAIPFVFFWLVFFWLLFFWLLFFWLLFFFKRKVTYLLASSIEGFISNYVIFKHVFSDMLGIITDRLIRKLLERIAGIGNGEAETCLLDHGGIVVAIANRDRQPRSRPQYQRQAYPQRQRALFPCLHRMNKPQDSFCWD